MIILDAKSECHPFNKHASTRLERSEDVTFKERYFLYCDKEETWICKAQTDSGWHVTIKPKSHMCSCPDSKPSYKNPPCKHKIALAKSIIQFVNDKSSK